MAILHYLLYLDTAHVDMYGTIWVINTSARVPGLSCPIYGPCMIYQSAVQLQGRSGRRNLTSDQLFESSTGLNVWPLRVTVQGDVLSRLTLQCVPNICGARIHNRLN